MSRIFRAAGLLAVLLLALLAPTWASDANVRTDTKTLFAAQTIAASGNATSAAFTAIGQSKDVSIQFRNTGTSPNYKLEVLCSLDETNFVKPETGGDIGTFTDQNFHIAAISVPFCKQLKIKVTELGGANSAVIDATICSQ